MSLNFSKLLKLALVLPALSLAACATAGADPESQISDPFEGYNRAVFAFNDTLDEAVLVPITKGYRTIVPQPARTGIHNVLANLKSPLSIGNQLLQGDLKGAGTESVRTVVNTLIGVGGLVDVAAMEGIEAQPEDFGQTLGVWGVEPGPYIVPPLLPPASLRDHVGNIVDTYADPVRIWLMNTDREGWYYAKVGVSFLDTREQLLDVLADLKKNSIDYYATIRSAYYQRRDAMVHDQKTDYAGGAADIPNYAAGEE